MRTFTVVTLDGPRLVQARSRDHLARILPLWTPVAASDARSVAAALWRSRVYLDPSQLVGVFPGAFGP